MTVLKFCFSFSVLSLFLACSETDLSKNFSLEIEGNAKKLQQGQTVGVQLKNRANLPIDSIVYVLDGSPVTLEAGGLTLNSPVLGTKNLQAKIFSEGRNVTVSRELLVLAESRPALYTYEIVNTFPHDPKAFTQGLEFYRDTLYESTGRRGTSSLRKVNYQTGEVLQKTDLEDQYFGEGLTVLNDTIFMLTWQAGTGFMYDRKTLQKLGSFQYGESKEGWGLTNDGKRIFKSDGTQRIWILDPATLKETGYLETVTDKSVFNKANELEYVGGKLYANVWQKESMMIIDAESGAIEGVVNFGGLKEKVGQHPDLDVFNGVAYHPQRQTFFVTGKNWDTLFEVRISKKN
ncbi:glutaminyl-peptide cyclotransferase [Robiginitalea aurantiaca]|uniref:Glutaminyl-peptide cyclotransferase n=1 Tax=Robiginitalea aurantiaca TaxID=3056915 RepID=A0ABT7WG76_9FLAO|nr:glutaminyl-peptide cyclotransferase [Robiginitalea aurantiaca]MDM9631919.1 glutaminyl-peptide cyclotransferase [Robiginitalea aurantiaca]